MISPRRSRLLKARTLQHYRRLITSGCASDGRRAAATAVIVPTDSAARELRRSIELEFLPRQRAIIMPALLTRDAWYARMHASLPDAPRMIGPLEREVMMTAAARDAIALGCSPPFNLRPGLIVEMLAFYDELRRRDQTVDRFETLLADKLESSVDDRGALRLLQQTRFLAASFRAYEGRVTDDQAVDEHALRRRLLTDAGERSLRRLIVTVGDRLCDPPGLWIADFDLMARMPGVEEIELIATESMLASGWHERLDAAMPGIEEVNEPDASADSPRIFAPASDTDRLYFVARDREEELTLIAHHLKAERRRDPTGFGVDGHAVVFKRPLPYLYLARTVFGSAGIPYQASAAVPLAAEPYAAAVDLVIAVVTSGFTRSSVVALLRSPHFAFGPDGGRVPPSSVRAFDRHLSETGYLGGHDVLCRVIDEVPRETLAEPAARTARRVVEHLKPLTADAPASLHLAGLRAVLIDVESEAQPDERHQRARDAILQAISDLAAAHERRDDPVVPFADVAARLRRWIDGQTFRPTTGTAGLHLVDADAAPFGTYESIHIVGLIERDWPEPAEEGIFYSPRLLSVLGWPSERDRTAAARAAFRDLLVLPSRRIACCTVTLEDEAVVDVSPFLDELPASGLAVERSGADRYRIFAHDALTTDPVRHDVITERAASWLALRVQTTSGGRDELPGRALPHWPPELAVSAAERYLECPFKYFAVHVLRLEEDPEDEDVMSPRTRGLFIHHVFQTFFEEWGSRGAITAERLDEARTLFVQVAERLLATLSPPEAALERTRLLGSAVATGLADAVFRVEAERPVPVVDRLLEFAVRGELDVVHGDERVRVRLRGTADRIDLLGDRTLRILDYKSGKAPQPRRALQLPLYSLCAAGQLAARDGVGWKVGEAAYIAFGAPRAFVPMTSRGFDEYMDEARGRLGAVVAGIQRGDFFVQPLEPFRCTFCAYAGVCRKDYVGDE